MFEQKLGVIVRTATILAVRAVNLVFLCWPVHKDTNRV